MKLCDLFLEILTQCSDEGTREIAKAMKVALKSSASNLALANTDIQKSMALIVGAYEIIQDDGRVG